MLAVIGITALWLTYGWLASAIVSTYLSERKGYGTRPGLAAGLLLTVVGVLIFLMLPARPHSDWKVLGPFGRGHVRPEDLVDPEMGREHPGGTHPGSTH